VKKAPPISAELLKNLDLEITALADSSDNYIAPPKNIAELLLKSH